MIAMALLLASACGGDDGTVDGAVPTTTPDVTVPDTESPITTSPDTTSPDTTGPVTTSPVTTRPVTTDAGIAAPPEPADDAGQPDFDGVFDALRASDVINGPVGVVTGMPEPGTMAPMVAVDVEPGQNPDMVIVCEEVARILDDITGVQGLAIQIGTTRGTDIRAHRPTGGDCTAN